MVDDDNIVTLGEGLTPLTELHRAGADIDVPNLFVKDEGVIPTGTFKARGASVGVSKAKELGIDSIAMPTNGNAGAAWATYCAKAGIQAHIVMPEGAPKITRNECAATGANVYLVDGLISDCGTIVANSKKRNGWFDASTLKEPYRIEGKKTMGYEIVEQFGWQVPDVIMYPTGGGVGIIGIFKALLEMQALGWIGEKLPRLVSVQSQGCAPIVQAWQRHATVSEFWPNSQTIAFGINVPKALGDFLVLDAIYRTNGCAVAVSDEAILESIRQLATTDGLFACPEGASLYVAARDLRSSGWLKDDDKVVLLNTGAGIKYPNTLSFDLPYVQKNAVI